jgi:hypothetical protein
VLQKIFGPERKLWETRKQLHNDGLCDRYSQPNTGSPRFAPVQFAPSQNNADFENRRSKSEKNIFYYYL